jgi:hypothetical protein
VRSSQLTSCEKARARGRVRRAATVAACVLVCVLGLSSCATGEVASPYVSRAAPNGRVLLVPELEGGTAGWCMATASGTVREGDAGCGPPKTSTGPIFAETCSGDESSLVVFALTRSEVAAVSVDGGPAVPTAPNATLPDGLRAVAVEVLRSHGRPSVTRCPRVTALDVSGGKIRSSGSPGKPQAFRLPGTRRWLPPAPQPPGPCRLSDTQLPPETEAELGYVAPQVRAYHGLLGQAFLSCIDTTYVYQDEHRLRAAVLLDAADPGASPPALPGMSPLVGHRGIFEAPEAEGDMAARRIPGAWLVVEEEDGIGLRVPVELLERLHAGVHV